MRMKQIGMMAILGLVLVLATSTVFVTTQSAQAIFGRGFGGNGVIGGGSAGGQDSQGQDGNSQGNEAGSGASSGAIGTSNAIGCGHIGAGTSSNNC